MKALPLLLASLFFVSSASAQVFIWDNDGNNAQIIGPSSGVQSYWDSKGNTGLILPPTEDRRIGSFQFRTPDGQLRSGTITDARPQPMMPFEDLSRPPRADFEGIRGMDRPCNFSREVC